MDRVLFTGGTKDTKGRVLTDNHGEAGPQERRVRLDGGPTIVARTSELKSIPDDDDDLLVDIQGGRS